MNLKRQLEMQRRYAAQARGEKLGDHAVDVVPMIADEPDEAPKRKPRKKAAEPVGGE